VYYFDLFKDFISDMIRLYLSLMLDENVPVAQTTRAISVSADWGDGNLKSPAVAVSTGQAIR
jgi:hypothetical protein